LEERTETERKRKVLTVILKELLFNDDQFDLWRNSDGDLPADDYEIADLSVFLKDEDWQAFRDGGEWEWVKDPELSGRISTTYHFINAIKKLSERYFTLVISRGSSVKANDIRIMTEKINEGAENVIEQLIETIHVIQEELK
jgi:hypothetical protein